MKSSINIKGLAKTCLTKANDGKSRTFKASVPVIAAATAAIGLAVAAPAVASTHQRTAVVSQAAVHSQSIAGSTRVASRSSFQGGYDRNHFWIKVSRSEVVSGATNRLCLIVMPLYLKATCPVISAIAGRIIGGNAGVWAEFYPGSMSWRYGTW